MRARLGLSVLLAGSTLLVTQLAWAQCTMDTECKGDRVCEAGACVTPSAPPAAAAPAPASAPAAPVVAPAVAPAQPAAAPVPAAPPPPRMERHSKGMMVGGIVMTSVAPVALAIAMLGSLGKSFCEADSRHVSYSGNSAGVSYGYRSCSGYDTTIYGGLISALVLVGVGVPLIVVGAKKEPVGPGATATLQPWAAPSTAGLSLRVDL